jgi:hypothetical protein
MSFVNEIGHHETVNDLRIDETLIVEGDATVLNKLTVKDIHIGGTVTGIQLDPTFVVGDEELTLVEKIAQMDSFSSTLSETVVTNTASLATKASKTALNLKAPLANPNFTGDISIDGETLTTKLSSYETTSTIDARFQNPTFDIQDVITVETEIHPLESFNLDVSKTRVVNGQEVTTPVTTDLKTLLDARYLQTNDVPTATENKVDKTNAEVIGQTLADVINIVLIPDPLQPEAKTETNLQTLLDAKLDPPENDTFATTTNLSDGLALKQDKPPDGQTFVTSGELSLQLQSKQNVPSASDSYVLTSALGAALIGKQNTPPNGETYALTSEITTAVDGKQDVPPDGEIFVLTSEMNTALDSKLDKPPDGTSYATTTDISGFATSEDVEAIELSVQSLASTTYVDNNFAKKADPTFNITDFGTQKTLSEVVNHYAPATDISGKLDQPDDFGTGTLTDYIVSKAPSVDLSGYFSLPANTTQVQFEQLINTMNTDNRWQTLDIADLYLNKLDTPDDFGTGTLADYVVSKAPATDISGKLDQPDDFGTGTLADYIVSKAPATDISGKLDQPDDFGTGTLADYIVSKAPATDISGKLDQPDDFGTGTLADYIASRSLSSFPDEKQYAGFKTNPSTPLTFELYIHNRSYDAISLRRLGFYKADYQTLQSRMSPDYFNVTVHWDEVSGIQYPSNPTNYFNISPYETPHYDLIYDMPNSDKISTVSDESFESKFMTIVFNDAEIAKSIHMIRLEFGTNSPPEEVTLRIDGVNTRWVNSGNIQYYYPPTTTFKSIEANHYAGIKTHMIDGLQALISERIALSPIGQVFSIQRVRVAETVDGYLSFAEIRIYQGSTELAVNKITTNFTEWSAYPIANVTDDNNNTIFHESGNTTGAYIEFEVSTPSPITQIVIHNRPESSLWNRMVNHEVTITNAFGSQKFYSKITTSQLSYTFNPSVYSVV